MSRNSLVLAWTVVAMVVSLAACEKKPEEKMDSDKEIQRLNEIGRQGNKAVDKMISDLESQSKRTKSPDEKAK